FVEKLITGERASLAGSEAHHLINVLRVKRGAKVTLFDGSGAEFSARVETIMRKHVVLEVLGRDEVSRELPFVLTLGVSLPKGERQKWLVEKAVELGVSEIVPLKTKWAVAQPVEQALARLRRTVIEASKQCGRNRLMKISEPFAWDVFVETGRDTPLRLIAHPGSKQTCMDVLRVEETPGRVLFAVGPVGGFANDEV
ncbi:MAG: RsmE family RNA methyltransferase, partial [Thermoguttaceae bacterium]